jgi:hypothetical protein
MTREGMPPESIDCPRRRCLMAASVPFAAVAASRSQGIPPMTTLDTGRRLRRGAVILAVAVALGCGAALAAVTSLTLPGIGTVAVQSFIVTVVKVNPATREVIVKTENGNQFAYAVSPIVVGLDQVRPNDHVDVSVVPGTITDLEKAQTGTIGRLDSDVIDASVFGVALPENFFATQVVENAMLVEVDPAARTVMFKGADGIVRTMPAANDEVAGDLPGVQPGDLFQLTYIEAMALKLHQ